MQNLLPKNIRMRGEAGYQADVKVNGRRVRRVFSTLSEAEAFVANPSVYLKDKLTVDQALHQAHNYHWRNSADARTCYLIVKEAVQELNKLGVEFITDVTNAHLMKLVEIWRAKGNKDSTINRKLARLHKALEYHRELGNLSIAPRIKTFKERATRMRYLTHAEENIIRSNLRFDDRHLFDFLISTGCRFSEATRVTWIDISPNKDQVTFWETKNNTSRTVPLMTKAKAAINHKITDEEGPFCGYSYASYEARFRRAVDNCTSIRNPEEITLHTLRHTSVSRMVQAGVDLLRVKEWHGHKSINTTLRYAHLAPKGLHRVADMLDRPSRPPQELREAI